MTQQPESFPPDPSDSAEDSSSRSGFLYWFLAVCAAVAIHLLTGYALFAAALPCALAAWKSFRCGFWLLRADPVAARGRACWWFFLAVACWKAAATALAIIVIFLALTGKPPPEKETVAASLILIGGLLTSTLIGIVALAATLRARVRVWVHPSVRGRCHGDFRRLAEYVASSVPYSSRPFNHAIPVLALSLFLPVLGAGTALLIATFALHPSDPPTVPCVIGFCLLTVGPLAMIPVYCYLSSRIIAKTPLDCWPLSTLIPTAAAARGEQR